jgi:hypothetical protein
METLMPTIEIRGLDALQRKLNSIAGASLAQVLRPPMQRAVLLLQSDMADYPPQRSGSSYRRTGTLGRTWTTKVENIPGGVQGKVGNVTEYAPLVQSEQFQSAVHRGRWTNTDEQVLRRRLAQIERMFQVAVDAALR